MVVSKCEQINQTPATVKHGAHGEASVTTVSIGNLCCPNPPVSGLSLDLLRLSVVHIDL